MRYTLPQPSTRWMIRETLAPPTHRRRNADYGRNPGRSPGGTSDRNPGGNPDRNRGGDPGGIRREPDSCQIEPPYPRPDVDGPSVPEADAAAPSVGEASAEPTPDPRPAPVEAKSPVPDPFQDADALEDLGDEIARVAAHIHAATQRLLLLIAEFDRREGWKLGGHRSCAHWLAYRTGMHLGAAREKVRTARALVGLPLIGASMARGELSFSKVRALSRVATPDNEAELLPCAQGATAAQLERMVRGYRLGSRRDEVELARERHRDRSFSVVPDVDGMYVVRGRLTPELGALLMRAVEAASDALYREGRRSTAGRGVEETETRPSSSSRAQDTEREAAQRRADALGLLAERALGAGFGDDEAPVSGSRAERYQVVLHVDAETLEEEIEGEPEHRGSSNCGCGQGADGSGKKSSGCGEDGFGCSCGESQVPGPSSSGRSELDDGTRVSAETSRRLSCDAGRVEMRHGPDGSILDVGRRTRTVPPALRRALEARDQGCRFPGCGLRFAEGHHVTHWADGGETKLENLVLLCRHHHRLLHEEGWSMQWWGQGRPVFFDPRGGTHFDGRWTWPGAEEVDGAMGEKDLRKAGGSVLASAPSLAADMVADNEAQGIQPHGRTASARWKTENHIPDSIYFQALEAMGEAGG